MDHSRNVVQAIQERPANNLHLFLKKLKIINEFCVAHQIAHSLKWIEQLSQQLQGVAEGKNVPLAFGLEPKHISSMSGHGCFTR